LQIVRWKLCATTLIGHQPSWQKSAAVTVPTKGSLWDRGILPQDSLKLLGEERGGYLEADTYRVMDWAPLRSRIKTQACANSNCVAIAPTATNSNIIGVSACIEPTYQNLYVKSEPVRRIYRNQRIPVPRSESTRAVDEVMIADLKYFDGSLAKIEPHPARPARDLRNRV